MSIPLTKLTSRDRSTIAPHRLPSPALSDEAEQPKPRDVEQPATADLAPDPYQLRGSMMTEEQLHAIRKRGGKGKAVVEYHRKQNEVLGAKL